MYCHKLYKIFELDHIENFINLLFDNVYSENDTSIFRNKFFSLSWVLIIIAYKFFFFNDSIYQATSA